MFCKNCGSEIKEGDQFCGECGFPVKDSNERYNSGSNHENTYRMEVNIPSFNLNGCRILDIAKMYFLKPLSFFSEFKNCDNVKTSIAVLLVLPILYGLISITYTACIITSFFSGIKKLPDILSKAGVIGFEEAINARAQFEASNDFLAFKSQIRSMIDNKDIFINSFLYLVGIIIITTIILILINAVVLKAKIKSSDIFFISSASYIPLVLSLALASLASLVSITFGIIIVIIGYVLSFITLYSGIRQFTDDKNDRVFAVMAILFLVMSIIISVVINEKIESSLSNLINYFKALENIL